MTQRTVIIGGGLAGLAAAAILAERGVPVTVLESRPRLGGRASSFLDKTTGAPIDNCQHVSLGCCTSFQHFCRTVGVQDLIRTEKELYFIGRDKRVNRFAASPLPAPFHLFLSFARLSYLSWRDLFGIAGGLRALARARSSESGSLLFSDWLQKSGQTPAAIDRFWTPVLVSALSETLDRIDVASARKVFVDAFLANRSGWRVQIPTVPLDVLYGERLAHWLSARGAIVRLQAGVTRVTVEEGRVAGVVLRSGETIAAEHVILTVPHWLVLDLLPEECRSHPQLASIGELESAPISSVHLWFDRPILFKPAASHDGSALRNELPHAVLIDRLSQWIFNRGVLQVANGTEVLREATSEAAASCERTHNYQVVISASREVTAHAQQQTIDRVLEEIGEIFPESRRATLLHSRLVSEHRAVFSVRPGAERCRPTQQSPVANLQLAGDWTRTGWPSTMEGAVRSGYLAAENVLRHLGRPERILPADLPVAPLAQLLLGLKGLR